MVQPGSGQLDWLRAAPRNDPRRYPLAFRRHPLYSSGGHDHDDERFAPQDAHGNPDRARGLRQFVAGTGVAFATPFLLTVKHSGVRDASRNAVLRLTLREDGYDWELVEATPPSLPNASPPDHGSAACH